MVFFNHATRQMTAKIVYYGPGLCGKTTNLSLIYERTAQKSRGEMVSLNTETDRTLFFDLLPMDVGVIGGFKAKLQLYTVPGQVFYNSTRKLVLKGVDGIVFVADSQVPMLDANRESLSNLAENLRELGLELSEIPLVFQWNKRDLKHIVPVELLERELNPGLATSFQAIARSGAGVFETLRGISRLALAQIKRLHLAEPGVPPSAALLPSGPGQAAAAPAPAAPRVAVPKPVPPRLAPPNGNARPAAQAGPGGACAPSLMPADLPTPTSLPEALGFLDLPTVPGPFAPGRGDGAADAHLPGPGGEPVSPGAGPAVKVMAPLVVKPLQAQPGKPGVLPGNGAPRLRVVPPVPLALARPRPANAPLLSLELPLAGDGELSMEVRILRAGRVVAEAAAPLAQAPEIVSIELKRS